MDDETVEAPAAPSCLQLVFEDDTCCISRLCGVPATWQHAEAGLALCDMHELNAQKWASGGLWRVGAVDVAYPSGWERLQADADGAAADSVENALITNETRLEGSGLVIERAGSGIVIEREPISGL